MTSRRALVRRSSRLFLVLGRGWLGRGGTCGLAEPGRQRPRSVRPGGSCLLARLSENPSSARCLRWPAPVPGVLPTWRKHPRGGSMPLGLAFSPEHPCRRRQAGRPRPWWVIRPQRRYGPLTSENKTKINLSRKLRLGSPGGPGPSCPAEPCSPAPEEPVNSCS